MHRWIDVFLPPLNNMIIEPAFGTFGTLPREVPWRVAQEKWGGWGCGVKK